MTPPVLFLIFNRPDLTQRVFQRIRAAAPQKLFIAADGPRKDHPADLLLCAQTRQIIKEVDWDCEVITLLRAENLGCGLAVSSAITWFFRQVNAGIILEDDCVPSISFFRFCEEMLERYREDERIMLVSGTNHLGTWKNDIQSFHNSVYGGIWGWATWSRAWAYYDYKMTLWSRREEIINHLNNVLVNGDQCLARVKIFDEVSQRVNAGDGFTWAYQWTFARLMQSGLSVVPAVNLVSNVGFGPDATHTTEPLDTQANRSTYEIVFPLRDPVDVAADREYDDRYFRLTNLPAPNPIHQPAHTSFRQLYTRVLERAKYCIRILKQKAY